MTLGERAVTAFKRIYVGEDDPDQMAVMKVLLGQMDGCQCSFFSDGLTLYQKAMDEPPNLIICDILLPTLSGIGVTRLLKIQDDTHQIKIIVVSTIRDKNIQERVKKAGADHFMAKPIPVKDFVQIVARYL